MADRFSGFVQRVDNAGFDRTGLFHAFENFRKAEMEGKIYYTLRGMVWCMGGLIPESGANSSHEGCSYAVARFWPAGGGVLSGEREALSGEREALSGERVALSGERVALSGERVALSGERVALSGERVALSGERVALSGEGETYPLPAGMRSVEVFRIRSGFSPPCIKPCRVQYKFKTAAKKSIIG
jgi:hypothetical protein